MGGRGQGAWVRLREPSLSTRVSPRLRTVQCQSDGRSCWCVGADGREVAGSRQPGRPVACKCERRGLRCPMGRGDLARAWHVTRPVSLWAAAAPGVRLTGLHARPLSCRAPVKSSGTIKALGQQVGAESLPSGPGPGPGAESPPPPPPGPPPPCTRAWAWC